MPQPQSAARCSPRHSDVRAIRRKSRLHQSQRHGCKRHSQPRGLSQHNRHGCLVQEHGKFELQRSLDLTLKHTSRRLTLLASYTYGKSLDWSSNLQEQVNPFNYRAENGISAFDIKHNFVLSYDYELPLERLFHSASRLTEGWAISGITRFATGLPVTLASNGDNFLVDAQNNGINSTSIDLPNLAPGDLQINGNPRNGHSYFNTALFSPNALGTQGNAPRRPFYGPGVNNWDIALHKVTKFTESKSLELRLETFNAFNHAQFYGTSSVDGNISDATFGKVLRAAPPRISQLALKFQF